MISVFDRVENNVGKGENAVSIFSFTHNNFPSLLTQGREKS